MQEDSETLLAKQASEASGSAPKISVDEDRLPQAKHLPAGLREYVLSNTKDCKSACKGYASGADEHKWVKLFRSKSIH